MYIVSYLMFCIPVLTQVCPHTHFLSQGRGKIVTHNSQTAESPVGWGQTTGRSVFHTHQEKLLRGHNKGHVLRFGATTFLENAWSDSTRSRGGPATGEESQCRRLDWRKKHLSHKKRARASHAAPPRKCRLRPGSAGSANRDAAQRGTTRPLFHKATTFKCRRRSCLS